MRKFEMRSLRVWKWKFDESLVKWEKWEQKERMREKKRGKRKESLVKFWVPWQFCISENEKKLLSRDPLEYKSIISQKPCCNNLFQVVVLEELAWMANSIATYSKKMSIRSDSECLGNNNSV